jgi:hypothetical protein
MLYSWSPHIVAREESMVISRKHLDSAWGFYSRTLFATRYVRKQRVCQGFFPRTRHLGSTNTLAHILTATFYLSSCVSIVHLRIKRLQELLVCLKFSRLPYREKPFFQQTTPSCLGKTSLYQTLQRSRSHNLTLDLERWAYPPAWLSAMTMNTILNNYASIAESAPTSSGRAKRKALCTRAVQRRSC